MVYTSGQIALIPGLETLEEADITKQTHRVCQNLSAVLKEAGTDLNHVVKTTCFLKNMADFAVFNAVYAEYFSQFPARSCVEVSCLPKGALVEIEAVAMIP